MEIIKEGLRMKKCEVYFKKLLWPVVIKKRGTEICIVRLSIVISVIMIKHDY